MATYRVFWHDPEDDKPRGYYMDVNTIDGEAAVWTAAQQAQPGHIYGGYQLIDPPMSNPAPTGM